MLRIGVIGYGGRAQHMLGTMERLNAGTKVVAITDVRNDAIREQLGGQGAAGSEIAFYGAPDEMLERESLDGVVIGTRCSLHTPMAVKVLSRDLPLFLEKPVATNMADLVTLRDAARRSCSEVVVSFPLRVTPLAQMAREILDSGQIGTVEHVQAWNDVPYGWIYFQGWYRDEGETQGLFLQKATHDFDYINFLLGTRATDVAAMTSKQIYRGDRPAGLRCDDCSEQDTCLESPFHLHFTRQESARVEPSGRLCGFAQDTGNEDSGSALIRYESGMHVSYSQNFFARKSAGRRGARLLGYRGTLEFDWYADELKVHMHHTPRTVTHKFDSASASHGGGDTVLADSFVRVMRRERPSVAPLSAGLQSVLMCLKAKESAMTGAFQTIPRLDDLD